MTNTIPTARFLAGTLLAAAAAAGAAGPVAAQERVRGADAVRTEVTLDPATGERSAEVLRPLTADERLRVEAALEEAGPWPGPVDGVFDDRTGEALSRLQRREGLAVCGCVDVETLERLGVSTRVVMTTLARSAAGSRSEVEVIYPSRPSPGLPGGERSRAADGERSDRAAERASGQGAPGGDRAAGRSRGEGPAYRRHGHRHGFRRYFGVPVLVPGVAPPTPLPPRLGEPAPPPRAPSVGRLPARPKPPGRVAPPR